MSKQIDLNDPTRNMYGLKPCPECGGTHCYPTRPTPKNPGGNVLCDDCGWNEPIVTAQDETGSQH